MGVEGSAALLRKDIDTLDKIVRGDNGKGLVTQMGILQAKVEAIYRLLWISIGGIVVLIIEMVADKIM